MPVSIRVVSFDADNTLWDFQLVMRAALGHVLAHLRALDLKGTDRLTVDQMIAIRERVFQERAAEGLRLEVIRELAFVETLRYVGLRDTSMASDRNRLYLEHRFRDIQLYDDVLPTLDKLSPRFALGLLSNGNSYPEKCGLGGRFAFAVFSQDHGIEKPDPRIFQVVFRQAHCRPSEVVHVGTLWTPMSRVPSPPAPTPSGSTVDGKSLGGTPDHTQRSGRWGVVCCHRDDRHMTERGSVSLGALGPSARYGGAHSVDEDAAVEQLPGDTLRASILSEATGGLSRCGGTQS